jgi:hypothetical protein
MVTWKEMLIGLGCIVATLSLMGAEKSSDSVKDAYACLRDASTAYTSVGKDRRAGEEVYVACMHARGYEQKIAWQIYREWLLRED